MTPHLATRLPSLARSAVCLNTTSTIGSLYHLSISTARLVQSPVKSDTDTSSERDTITVLRDEYSKSGGDDTVAEQDVASYGRTDTDPASQLRTAGQGNPVNPLEVSPANREVSRMTVEKEVHPGGGAEKTAASRRAAPAKGKATSQYETKEMEKAVPVGSRQVG